MFENVSNNELMEVNGGAAEGTAVVIGILAGIKITGDAAH